jgi:hypothetical protein
VTASTATTALQPSFRAPEEPSPDAAPEVVFPATRPEGTEIASETMDVTPQMARQWLDRHGKIVAAIRAANGGKARSNRPIRWGDAGVAGLARDMKGGRWVLNGQTVKLAWNGTVPDGQHRLYACIEAQVPFRTIVVTGVDPEAQDTIDIGLGRKLSDSLAMNEEVNSAILGAVGRWSLRWLHGWRGGTGGSGGSKPPQAPPTGRPAGGQGGPSPSDGSGPPAGNRPRASGTAYKPTRSELMEYIARAPHLREATAFAAHARWQFRPVRASVWGMAWLLFHELDPLAAKVFLDRVLDPDEMPKRHPAGAFRTRIMNAVWNKERLTESEQLALLIIAWNFWRDNREVAVVQLPKGGVNSKNFPVPK